MVRCHTCDRPADPFYIVQLKGLEQKFQLCYTCQAGRLDIAYCSPPQKEDSGHQPQMLAIKLLHDNPYQPRHTIGKESLMQLAETIKSQGFQGVLVARPHPTLPGNYQLTAGHRRREAATLAGLSELPVIVGNQSNHEMAALAATENIQREDLSALEEGRLFQVMINVLNLTLPEIGDMVKKDRNYVRNRLRLANAPEDIQSFVATKSDGLSAVYYLVEIEDPAERASIIELLLKKALTATELPKYIEAMKRHKLEAVEAAEMERPEEQSIVVEPPAQASSMALPTQSIELPARLPEVQPPIQSLTMEPAQSLAATPPSSEAYPSSGVRSALDETVQTEQPAQPADVRTFAIPAPVQPAPPVQLGRTSTAAHAAAQEQIRQRRLKSILSYLNQYQELIPQQGTLSENEQSIIRQILAVIQAFPYSQQTDGPEELRNIS